MATKAAKKARAARGERLVNITRPGKNTEPTWDGAETWDGETFHKVRKYATEFYYEHFKHANLANDFYLWMKKTGGYTPAEIDLAKKVSTVTLGVVTGYMARMRNRGMPSVHEGWNTYWEKLGGTSGVPMPVDEYLKERADELIERGASTVAVATDTKTDAPVAQRPNIQDVLKEKNSEVLGEIEGKFDDFTVNDFKGDPGVVNLLTANNIAAAQLKTYVDFAEKNIAYYNEVLAGTDSQLLEGHKHWGKRQMKAVVAWWTQVLADVNSYANIKKVSKAPRKRKPVSPEKQVSKLKYLKEFAELGLKSIAPTAILEASELWVYNTKTRKLGIYIADTYQPTLMVKNSTIMGFSAADSVQKTLRKPKDQLKEFSKNGKPAAKKWFKEIKTTEIKLNGRLNADTILLKAYK